MKNSLTPLQDSSPSGWKTVRLVATDMDGTLTEQGQFTPDLVRSLTQLAANRIPTLIVTGRSAGWVQGLVAYLPVVGAIAENGGVFIAKDTGKPTWLIELANVNQHREHLATMFAQLLVAFPSLVPSVDNQFRLTDWTFDIGSLSTSELQMIDHTCREAGWGFTYSTVQCHIRAAAQDKGVALKRVLQQCFPSLTPQQVVTVGDSPNDEGLFDASLFPLSVGVANIKTYRDRLSHLPTFVTQGEEAQGFQELVAQILN
jgi:HAD superfamily hydrolase (TIGR01484 family)